MAYDGITPSGTPVNANTHKEYMDHMIDDDDTPEIPKAKSYDDYMKRVRPAKIKKQSEGKLSSITTMPVK
jgi:hypothetical protein